MTTPASPENNPLPLAPETRFAVLFFTDIVGSTDLKARHGVPAYSAALHVHNDHFERVTRECRGIRILQNMGDGYFAEAGSVAEAVRFSLLFQDAMRTGPWREIQLTTRVGIHAGEVAALVTEGGSGIVAPAADLAARVMSLAVGGQILLTRFPFDEARHFLREHPAVAGRATPPLCWLAHGPYLLKGRDESMEIFEVGAEGLAPLAAPPDGEKAKRAIRPGEEETLGWRPAIGLEIPGRAGWRLTALLGKGGFGEVWTGEHAKLRQRRAFKFCFDDERLRALKREVTLVRLLRTALGDRDDIVRFHELKLDEPPFYLESDLAPHGNLLQWAEKQGGLAAIPLAQRIALVAHTATALAAAHSIGVLHKDIKPTNVLIFDGPDGPRPRLVDFGIGTLADPAVLGQHGVTAAGFTRAPAMHSTGTPTYSPPEYLAGKPYTVQGDIYALGVLLYQLIAAKPIDPIAPGWERDIADPLLREDIVSCVDGDPTRRLTSAADLADRLFYLDQRRSEIAAKERLSREAAARAEAETAAAGDRLRAMRLGKLAGAFATLALLALVACFFAGLNQHKADAARNEVERKNTEYRLMLVEAARSDRLIAEEKLRAGQELAALAHLARACEYDPQSMLAAEKGVAALNWDYLLPGAILVGHEDVVSNTHFSPDGTRVVTASHKTARLWDAATGKAIATLAGHRAAVLVAQFNPDGTRIVTAARDKTVRLWDAVTGKPIATVEIADDIEFAQFSPDRNRIVTSSYGKTARVWDAITGKPLTTLTGHGAAVTVAQFSPDGTRIVTASSDKTARVWDSTTGKALTTLPVDVMGIRAARFSPDGTRIVTSSYNTTTMLWNAVTGKPLTTLARHGAAGMGIAQFSRDGTRIVTASGDKTVRVWDTATGQPLITIEGDVRSAEFSPDGTRILAVSRDRTARLWDAATGKRLATLAGHGNAVVIAQFSPDGSRIVTASDDKTARLWDVATEKPPGILAGHVEAVEGAQFSPDGTRIVTASDDKTARLWDGITGKPLATLVGHENGVETAGFSPNGARIVTASRDKTARLWDGATGKSLATFVGHDGSVRGARFSPDGTRVVTASHDNTARVWDAASAKLLAVLTGHGNGVETAEFSPNGTRILTASRDKTARLWDAVTGKPLATLTNHDDFVWSAEFSPDGTRILTASRDKIARLWDTATGKLLTTLTARVDLVVLAQVKFDMRPTRPTFAGIGAPQLIAQFSPNGNRIVTASSDRTARLWDAASGKVLATLIGHEGHVSRVHFSPDGTRIMTASDDKSALVWDAITGKAIATLAGHDGIVCGEQFSPDGTRIVTASTDRTARLWSVLPSTAGPPPEWFPDFLRYMAQMRLNPHGELETLKAADWLVLRERLRKVLRAGATADTPYLRILRKYVRE